MASRSFSTEGSVKCRRKENCVSTFGVEEDCIDDSNEESVKLESVGENACWDSNVHCSPSERQREHGRPLSQAFFIEKH